MTICPTVVIVNKDICTCFKDHLFVTGGASGSQDSSDTFIYDRNSDLWRHAGAMPTSRYELSCGAYADPAAANVMAVAAGGYNIADGGGVLSTVEIFNFDAGTWSTGNPLPTPLQDATSIQVG